MNAPDRLQPLELTAATPFPGKSPGFYERLRGRITRWAERKGALSSHATNALLAFPDLLRLMGGLALDPDVPVHQKAKLTIALFYIVSPLDFLPEALFGPAACLDDLAVAVIVLNGLLNNVDERVILRHWKGEGNAIRTIRHFTAVADELVGSGLLQRLRRFFKS